MHNADDGGALCNIAGLVGQMDKTVICTAPQTLPKEPLRPRKNPLAAPSVMLWTNKLVRKPIVDALMC